MRAPGEGGGKNGAGQLMLVIRRGEEKGVDLTSLCAPLAAAAP